MGHATNSDINRNSSPVLKAKFGSADKTIRRWTLSTASPMYMLLIARKCNLYPWFSVTKWVSWYANVHKETADYLHVHCTSFNEVADLYKLQWSCRLIHGIAQGIVYLSTCERISSTNIVFQQLPKSHMVEPYNLNWFRILCFKTCQVHQWWLLKLSISVL